MLLAEMFLVRSSIMFTGGLEEHCGEFGLSAGDDHANLFDWFSAGGESGCMAGGSLVGAAVVHCNIGH